MPRKSTKKAEPTPRTVEELKAAHKGYMLRTCGEGMTAHGGFIWPKVGLVTCPDWNKRAQCGNGLHGLLWGAGDASLLNWDPGAPWLVVGIDEWVEINGKVKAPAGDVVYCGDMRGAADLLVALGADPGKCIGSVSTAGDGGTATAGDGGTATAGDGGTATAGYGGTATAGYGGCLAIQYWDSKRKRYCMRIGYVGEDGLQAETAYRLDGDKFVPVPKPFAYNR